MQGKERATFLVLQKSLESHL